MTRVRRRRGKVEVALTSDDATLVQWLASAVAELLAPDVPTSDDPLEELVGIGAGPTVAPEDPALRRLLPDAYSGDEEAAAEFRRLMDDGLRRAKVAALEALATTVAERDPEQPLVLTDEETEAWLQALNDVRLTLGSRLDVREDLEELAASLTPEDPRLPLLLAYDRLTLLQQLLLDAVDS